MAELPLQELHDRLLLLGFVLDSINKLGHASSMSKNYFWKEKQFPSCRYALWTSWELWLLSYHTMPAVWPAGAFLAYIKQ